MRRLVIALAVVDALLLVANAMYHIMNRIDAQGAISSVFRWKGWYGGADGSVIELVGHAQLLIASVLLIIVGSAKKRRVFLTWGVAFTVMALDDVLRLHERTGAAIVELTGDWNQFSLTSQYMGELIFWALAAMPLSIWLLVAHRTSGGPTRRSSYVLFRCTLFLAFFAVGIDLSHAMLESRLATAVNVFLNLVETAGELVGMSLIFVVATAFSLFLFGGDATKVAEAQ